MSYQFLVQQATKKADLFIYLKSNMLSTERCVNIPLSNKLGAMKKLSLVGKSGLSDKMKRDFFQDVFLSLLSYEMDIVKTIGKAPRWLLYNDDVYCIKSLLEIIVYEKAAT